MWWSVILLVVCLVLAVGVFVVASQMDVPSSRLEELSSFRWWFGSSLARARGAAKPNNKPSHGEDRRHGASAVATHAIGAPSVWVGRPRVVRPYSAPVDMGMSEFFAATTESKPGYVDAEELTDVLHRARSQAQRTLHAPLSAVHFKSAKLLPGQLRAVRPSQNVVREPPTGTDTAHVTS